MAGLERVAVVACDPQGRIGQGDGLPWHCPEDLHAFRALTLGHQLLVGRRTFDGIIARRGRPLEGREMRVLTSHPGRAWPGVHYFAGLAAALAGADSPLFVIGGASVYTQCRPLLTEIYLSLIPGEHRGDVYLPDLGRCWRVVAIEQFSSFSRWRLRRDEAANFDWQALLRSGA